MVWTLWIILLNIHPIFDKIVEDVDKFLIAVDK